MLNCLNICSCCEAGELFGEEDIPSPSECKRGTSSATPSAAGKVSALLAARGMTSEPEWSLEAQAGCYTHNKNNNNNNINNNKHNNINIINSDGNSNMNDVT